MKNWGIFAVTLWCLSGCQDYQSQAPEFALVGGDDVGNGNEWFRSVRLEFSGVSAFRDPPTELELSFRASDSGCGTPGLGTSGTLRTLPPAEVQFSQVRMARAPLEWTSSVHMGSVVDRCPDCEIELRALSPGSYCVQASLGNQRQHLGSCTGSVYVSGARLGDLAPANDDISDGSLQIVFLQCENKMQVDTGAQ